MAAYVVHTGKSPKTRLRNTADAPPFPDAGPGQPPSCRSGSTARSTGRTDVVGVFPTTPPCSGWPACLLPSRATSGWSAAATSARPRWPSSPPPTRPQPERSSRSRSHTDDAGCDTNLRDATRPASAKATRIWLQRSPAWVMGEVGLSDRLPPWPVLHGRTGRIDETLIVQSWRSVAVARQANTVPCSDRVSLVECAASGECGQRRNRMRPSIAHSSGPCWPQREQVEPGR